MGHVNCYVLTLYCDAKQTEMHHKYEAGMAEFIGRNFTDAAKEAKRAGWTVMPSRRLIKSADFVYGQGTAICPACTIKRKGASSGNHAK